MIEALIEKMVKKPLAPRGDNMFSIFKIFKKNKEKSSMTNYYKYNNYRHDYMDNHLPDHDFIGNKI